MGLTLGKSSLQGLDGAEVSEIQVLKNLRCAPLALGPPSEVLDTVSAMAKETQECSFAICLCIKVSRALRCRPGRKIVCRQLTGGT